MADETSNVTTLQAAGSWTNESNFTGAHDGNCMTVTAKDLYSGEFSFNFSSVSGTIDGIEVMLHSAAGDADDLIHIELYDSTSTWRSSTDIVGGSASSCADCADNTKGGATDKWGGTWTDTHIKSTSFRIRIDCAAGGKAGDAWYADHATCKVYYTETGPVTTTAIIFQMT